MFQIGVKLQLWENEELFQSSANLIDVEFRGNNDDLNLTAELYNANLDDAGNLRRLPVAAIASGPCPTKRDLYLERINRINNDVITWGRIAGHLIERYLKGILDYFENFSQSPKKLRLGNIDKLANEYDENFWVSNQNYVNRLREVAQTDEETPERLRFLLKQTVKYELSLLSLDFQYRKKYFRKFVPLLEKIPIRYEGKDLIIQPSLGTGLSEQTTPDFIVGGNNIIIGEVKTGRNIEEKHLLTVAGYALAYENQYHVHVNYGMVYFFDTHVKQMSFARAYVFVIDNLLRKLFLYERDKAFNVLRSNSPPDLASIGKCESCKYLQICRPNI